MKNILEIEKKCLKSGNNSTSDITLHAAFIS